MGLLRKILSSCWRFCNFARNAQKWLYLGSCIRFSKSRENHDEGKTIRSFTLKLFRRSNELPNKPLRLHKLNHVNYPHSKLHSNFRRIKRPKSEHLKRSHVFATTRSTYTDGMGLGSRRRQSDVINITEFSSDGGRQGARNTTLVVD